MKNIFLFWAKYVPLKRNEDKCVYYFRPFYLLQRLKVVLLLFPLLFALLYILLTLLNTLPVNIVWKVKEEFWWRW